MYELLYAKSRYDVMYGVRSRKVDGRPVQYHYNFKGQWQGKYNNSIQVNGAYKFNPVIPYSFSSLSASILKNDFTHLSLRAELIRFFSSHVFLTYISDHHEIQTLCI